MSVDDDDKLDYSEGKQKYTKEQHDEDYWFFSLAMEVTTLQPSRTKKDPDIWLRPEVIQANIANRDDFVRYLKWKEHVPRDVFYNKMRAQLGTCVSAKLITAGDGNKALSELMFLYDEIQDGETECQNYRAFADVMAKRVSRKFKGVEEEKKKNKK